MNGDNHIFHDLVIKATQKEVFDAVSLPEHLNNWWTLSCEGLRQKAAIYNFYFAPEYNWFGEVITCKPNSAFHIKMTKADADWNPTSFGFDIEEHESGVRLQFWHKNWPHCNAHFRHSSYCWAMLLSNLRNYLEKSVIVPFVERE